MLSLFVAHSNEGTRIQVILQYNIYVYSKVIIKVLEYTSKMVSKK